MLYCGPSGIRVTRDQYLASPCHLELQVTTLPQEELSVQGNLVRAYHNHHGLSMQVLLQSQVPVALPQRGAVWALLAYQQQVRKAHGIRSRDCRRKQRHVFRMLYIT